MYYSSSLLSLYGLLVVLSALTVPILGTEFTYMESCLFSEYTLFPMIIKQLEFLCSRYQIKLTQIHILYKKNQGLHSNSLNHVASCLYLD